MAGPFIDGVNHTRGGLSPQNVNVAPPVDSKQGVKVAVNAMGAE